MHVDVRTVSHRSIQGGASSLSPCCSCGGGGNKGKGGGGVELGGAVCLGGGSLFPWFPRLTSPTVQTFEINREIHRQSRTKIFSEGS